MLPRLLLIIILTLSWIAWGKTERIVIDEGVKEPGFHVVTDDPDVDLQRDNFKNYGTFLLLDKSDHSVREIDASVGVISTYRNLSIVLISCWDSNKNDNNHKALVKISEDDRIIFNGWMFSRSPSLSTMEHPGYYIQISGCSDNQW